jgi:TRAP-type C4-dicarboxylate transport system substrate-binding protein
MTDAKAMRDMQAAGVQISVIPEDEWAKMESAARELWEAYADQDEFAAKGVDLLKKFLAELGR